MKSVLIILDYFGQWPEWFPVFLASCAANPTVCWLIHTDCPVPSWCPTNVKIVQISWRGYCALVSERLDISFRPDSPYNICNLKVALGAIHEDALGDFDYFGYGDLDVIYGNIRAFYDVDVLTHTFVSASGSMMSGHLTLLKNDQWVRNAFRLIPHWRETLENCGPVSWETSLDEGPNGLTRVATQRWPDYVPLPFFKEQLVTPLCPHPWTDCQPEHPTTWYWRNGRVTNSMERAREFIYLHLMNFRYPRYLDPKYGPRAPWQDLPRIAHFDAAEYRGQPVRIDFSGIHLLAE